MKRQKRSFRALTLAAFTAVLTLSFVGQSFAAAMAPDVDPSRYRIGNIFYPPGVKPAPGTETFQNGQIVTNGTAPHAAVTIQPKPKVRAKHKHAE
jgi:hypothetical protein